MPLPTLFTTSERPHCKHWFRRWAIGIEISAWLRLKPLAVWRIRVQLNLFVRPWKTSMTGCARVPSKL